MQTNRTMFSPRSSKSESARQREVEGIVEGLIVKRGYHSVINELLIALHNLAEISLASLQNQSNEQEFQMWARAVRTAIKRHSEECTFEKRVNQADAFRARGMGIRLD
jgi:hypothetical protein